MRLFVVFALLVAAALASPLPGRNAAVGEDWQLIPDSDGRLHLVDVVAAAAAAAAEPRFNAWQAVRILLVTRANRQQPIAMRLGDVGQLRSTPFNAAHQTRFIIHGWNNDGQSGVNQLLRNAYLDRGNFNVFIVDWGAGAQTANYAAARNRVNDVGHFAAQYIDFLHQHGGAAFSSITVVGHSLGAHTAGICGKRVTRGRLQTVVALDPALPLFSVGAPGGRVHYTDAHYVEVIHTDIGRLGFDQPIGDASFYPNWGRGQPGCGLDAAGMCSHSRAWEFFAQSIAAGNAFWATRCSGWPAIQARACPPHGQNALMGGEPVTRAANGVYYLETGARAPWALGWR